MRRPLSALVLSILCAHSFTSTHAEAQSSASAPTVAAKPLPQLIDIAARHHDDGVKLFQDGNYAAARIEFEASLALSKEPEILFNLSLTAERQGQLLDAVRFSEQYLAARPDASDSIVLRERIGRMKAAAVASNTALVLPVSDVTLASGTGATPVASPSSEHVGPALTKSASSAAIGLFAAGGGLLAAGLGCGAGSLALAAQTRSADALFLQEYRDTSARGASLSTAAITLSAVGGSVLIVGTGLALYQKHRHR